ncbi:MAG: hypothetical protein AB7O24_14385 [Kofleriaceae bacterium]
MARPTRFVVSTTESAGVVAAERRVPGGGWEATWVDLAIDSGELVLVADETGALTAQRLAFAIRSIDLPEDLLGDNAQITGIRLELVAPARSSTAWLDDERASAAGVIELDLSWRLAVGDAQLQLGTPELSAVPFELVVRGHDQQLDAQLRLHATGELWSWAEVLRLSELRLLLDGSG